MPIDYSGEGIRIAVGDPKVFSGSRALVEADVNSVTVEILSNDYVDTIVAKTAMTWSDDDDTWVYIWDTSQYVLDATNYRAKVIITDLAGVPSIEYGRIRLRPDPRPEP